MAELARNLRGETPDVKPSDAKRAAFSALGALMTGIPRTPKKKKRKGKPAKYTGTVRVAKSVHVTPGSKRMRTKSCTGGVQEDLAPLELGGSGEEEDLEEIEILPEDVACHHERGEVVNVEWTLAARCTHEGCHELATYGEATIDDDRAYCKAHRPRALLSLLYERGAEAIEYLPAEIESVAVFAGAAMYEVRLLEPGTRRHRGRVVVLAETRLQRREWQICSMEDGDDGASEDEI